MCGNFVFIGYNSGHVDKFNIQSGIHRGERALRITLCMIYKNLLLKKIKFILLGCLGIDDQPAHPGASIRGITTDGLNQLIITGDNKGLLKFWRFSNNNLLKGQIVFDSSIRHMILHR